jgi:multidrug efflux pump subunit AcrA (membrane-fusion protein)
VIAGLATAAILAGAIGYGLAERRAAQLHAARARIADLEKQLADSGELVATTRSELAGVQSSLSVLQEQQSEVDARLEQAKASERQVEADRSAARQEERRLAALRSQLDRREASLDQVEKALKSYDVGHPLLEFISDDGTWVVGRDIAAGVWDGPSWDTGCSWSVSDGRQGRGDGGYDGMTVRLAVGQSFTVRGCGAWSIY